jgi:hypothetical protein
MPAIGAEVADAYIEVHADTGPFRRELRREAVLAAQDASNSFGDEFRSSIDKDLSPLGASISSALRDAGELGGRELIEEIADQVRARSDRINTAFARSLTFNDFGDFIQNFSELDDAIEEFDRRIIELNRDGVLTNATFDRLNASFNAYVRTIKDDAISQALARDRAEAVALEAANERLITSLDKSGESARRFNIGLGSLKGSRNDFLNFIGTVSGFLERNIGAGLERMFQGIGNGVSSLGRSLSDLNGPLGAVGRGLNSFGSTINKLGAGGLDGLLVQIGALIIGLQLLIAVMGPLAAGLSGVAAAFTALAVGIGGALLGGILALGPGLAAVAAGAGAVAIAFSDLSKQQKAVFGPLQDLFNEVRESVQQRLFDGLGGQVDGLTSALAPLGPFLTRLAGVFRSWVDEVVGEIGPNGPLAATFQSLGRDLPGIFRTLLDLVSATGGALTGLFAGAAPGAQRLFTAITGVVEQFSAWANTSAGQQQINNFMQQAVDILGLLWDIATQVGAALGALWGGGAQQAASQLLTLVRDLATSFTEWLNDPGNRQQLLEFFRNGVMVATSLGTIIGALGRLFGALDTQISRIAFQVLIGHVVAAIDAFSGFVRWTTDVFNSIGRLINRVNVIAQSLGNLGSRAATAGQNFRTTLGNAFTAVMGFISRLIASFNRLPNPMQQAAQAGQRLRSQLISAFNGAAQGVANAISRAISYLNNLISSALNTAGRVAGALRSLAGQAAQALGAFAGAIQRGISTALSTLGGFAGRAVGALAGIAGRFVSIGLDIMGGLYRGVVSGAGRVLSYIRGLAGEVAATFASVLGIASPSKVFRALGGFTIDGFIEGMERREKAANKEAGTLAEGVINSAITTLERAQGSIRNTAILVSNALASAGRNPAVDKAFKQLGVGAIKSLTDGLDNGREAAQEDVKRIVEAIGKVAERAMKGEDKRTRAVIQRQADALRQWVRGQAAALDAVWREVDRAGVRIEAARDRLQELQQDFTQMRESVRDSLRGELDLAGGIQDDGTATFESVASQVSGLASRMKKFASLIKKLIKAGFPPALVQEVAALGSTEGIAVANALLSGTKAQQQQLIADFGSIQQASDQIGLALAEQMYRAGIEAQKGLIRGLEANREALIKAAKKIAKTIADEVRRELGIKSPSRVFQQIGEFITEGLARGIESGSSRVNDAVRGMVDTSALTNLNSPLGSLGNQTLPSGSGSAALGGIEAGAITIVTPFANPRLVAIEALDALAARGK